MVLGAVRFRTRRNLKSSREETGFVEYANVWSSKVKYGFIIKII